MTTPSRLGLATVVAGGAAAAFTLGLLSIEGGNDAVYLSVLVVAVAAATWAALGLTLGKEPRLAPSVALGALVFAALLTMFVLGLFTPYAGGWGHRDLEQFGGSDWTWPAWLSFLFVAAAISGAFFGALLGLVSWRWRLLRFRRHLS